ncbi:MAG TPA: alpha/beta hydrolase [Planctomycetota bacterium]|nr:alpha/beta hydrolase [Planctomycetota bacterium]
MKHAILALFAFLVLACSSNAPRDPLEFHDGTTRSTDGVPIEFTAGGQGETALVFVHGWLGDQSVWYRTMQRFAPRYRVVAMDLAGHGKSGRDRQDWSVERFADDVSAVVRSLDLHHAILVGHSMSGPISVAAANKLGDRVDALIPVDTLLDAEWDLPPEVWKQFFDGLRADFPANTEAFFRGILAAPTSPKAVIDEIVAKARLADPVSAVPMLENGRDYDLKAGLRALRVPIRAINSDMNPTKLETNRKYAPRFDVEIVSGVGHWPHLEAPDRFGDALDKVLAALGR